MTNVKWQDNEDEILQTVAPRRVSFMSSPDDWFTQIFDSSGFRSPVILPIIIEHTKGRFYLSSNSVGFEDEIDMIMFKLRYVDD